MLRGRISGAGLLLGWLSMVAYVWSFHWLWEGQDAFEFPPFPEEGAWLVLPWEPDLAFTRRVETLWERALARLGVDPASVSSSSTGVS